MLSVVETQLALEFRRVSMDFINGQESQDSISLFNP